MSRGLVLFLAALTVAAGAGGCTTNPATGRQFFTGFLTEAGEEQLGMAQHGEVLAQFGGSYDDPALNAYVTSLGDAVVQASERPDRTFTFTILDTPIINAFALPGGYVYVTRGLLAMADSEAELAGVLAHEIGHVTAQHAAERYGRAVLASFGLGGLEIAAEDPVVARMGEAGASVHLQSYSREQEYEADLLAVRYLARTGHDPAAVSSMLEKLQRQQRLEARLQGRDEAELRFNMSTTHPRTVERIERAAAAVGGNAVAGPRRGRDDYLHHLDGLLYGDDFDAGLVRGRHFAHPKLRFAFDVPLGFTMVNGTRTVFARGPGQSAIIFDRGPEAGEVRPSEYLQRLNLQMIEPIQVNGLEAATGVTRVGTSGGPADLRVVALRYDPQTVYRFIFVTPVALTPALSAALRQTAYSFRRLSAEQAAVLRPLRLRVVAVRPGDTVASLARRMAVEDAAEERFRILNGLPEAAELQPGQLVKLIVA